MVLSESSLKKPLGKTFPALMVLFLGLILTLVTSFYTNRDVESAANKDFQSICSDIQTKIYERLNAHAQLLRCSSAFFAASSSVTRQDWRFFYEKSNIDKILPGIQGLGFSMIVPQNKLQEHILEVRKEGFPEYVIRPEGDRAFYTTILYIEPFGGRNLRAFGYDMFTEPVRRYAMETARDSNMTVLTGKVVLIQETNKDVQAGTLMYVPVYREGEPAATVEQRRAAIIGWVYSPYRMNDLMDGVLGRWGLLKKERVHLQIFDGSIASQEFLLYNSGRNDTVNHSDFLTYLLPVEYHGKKWTLLFTQSGFTKPIVRSRVIIVFFSGIIISLLLFSLSLSLLNTRFSAQKIAGKLTSEIKEASARLTLAARAGGVGIWDFDPVNNSLICDDEMYALYGIAKDGIRLSYDAWMNSLHPDDAERSNREIQMAISGEKDFEIEFRVIWPDGSIHNIRGLALVIRDDTGKALHLIGTNWDITENKKAEKALIKAKQEAEKANKAKSEFLANMSHEIRTPMNAILGYSELLSYVLKDKTQKGYLDSIKSSGRTLLTLINDILDLSKIEAGKLQLDYDYIETSTFFNEFGKIFSLKISEKNLRFITCISETTPTSFYLDGPRLRQIILNLVGNAVKFTEDGQIELKIRGENKEVAKSSKTKIDGTIDLVIEVKDTGIGIPEEYQERIMESFVQVHSKTNLSGTGLGLPIAKRLTELMNGRLELKSKTGEGSTFTVVLSEVPFLMNHEKLKTEVPFNPSDIIFEKATILIADDIENNRRYIRDVLSGTNLTVIEAVDGLNAISLIEITMPDLVIIDIVMPGLDGFELLARIKGKENLKHIPVIAYSASVMKEQQEKIRQSEFAGLLIKPVQISDLYIQLMNHLAYSMVSPVEPEADLSGDETADLHELISSLEGSFFEKWMSFKSRQPLAEVKEFGESLVQLGNCHRNRVISEYGAKLAVAADSFNLEDMLKLLGKYQAKIEELKK
jgi:PAS domain S-box-containing protein